METIACFWRQDSLEALWHHEQRLAGDFEWLKWQKKKLEKKAWRLYEEKIDEARRKIINYVDWGELGIAQGKWRQGRRSDDQLLWQ